MSSPPENPERPSIGRSLFGALMLLGFALGAATVFLGVLNHDVAWYLYAAGRVLAGDRLYVDLIETNPPLIVWLNLVPQFLARAAGISSILTLRLLMLGLIAASLLVTRSALLRAMPDRPCDRRVFLLLSLVILLAVPGYDFAQREHLLLVLFLPYLVMASGRAKGITLAGALPWLVGLMAGLGLAIKPHFLLPWVAIEVYLGVRRGWRIWVRPETLAIAAVGVSYLAAVLVIAPEYLQLMRWIGPLYSSAGRATFAALASEPGLAVAILALLGYLALRPKGDGRETIEVVLIADLGLLAIAILQAKGYSYHFYPPMALAILLIGLLATGSPSCRFGLARLMMRGVLVALLLLVAATRVQESRLWRGQPGESDTTYGRMIRVLEAEAKGGSVFTFSTVVAAAFPVVNYGEVGWASCHPALQFLPAHYAHDRDTGPVITLHTLDTMDQTERRLFDGVVDRLLTDRPTVMFVDETEKPRAFLGRRFDYLKYYALDPRFAEFLKEYEAFDKVDEFRVYRKVSHGWNKDEHGSKKEISFLIRVPSVAHANYCRRPTSWGSFRAPIWES